MLFINNGIFKCCNFPLNIRKTCFEHFQCSGALPDFIAFSAVDDMLGVIIGSSPSTVGVSSNIDPLLKIQCRVNDCNGPSKKSICLPQINQWNNHLSLNIFFSYVLLVTCQFKRKLEKHIFVTIFMCNLLGFCTCAFILRKQITDLALHLPAQYSSLLTSFYNAFHNLLFFSHYSLNISVPPLCLFTTQLTSSSKPKASLQEFKKQDFKSVQMSSTVFKCMFL